MEWVPISFNIAVGGLLSIVVFWQFHLLLFVIVDPKVCCRKTRVYLNLTMVIFLFSFIFLKFQYIIFYHLERSIFNPTGTDIIPLVIKNLKLLSYCY